MKRYNKIIMLVMIVILAGIFTTWKSETVNAMSQSPYYNTDIPLLNTWTDNPQTYYIGLENDVANNKYTSLDNMFKNRVIFQGDKIIGQSNDDYNWYLMLRGTGDERFVGITERFAAGTEGNTYSFGNLSDKNNCFRNLYFTKLENLVLFGTSSSEGGRTNEEDGERPYNICDSKCVESYSLQRKIIYDYQGGFIPYEKNPDTVNISNEDRTIYLYKPVKDGYHFAGWYGGGWVDHEDGTVSHNLPAREYRDLDYKATYVPANTVRFVAGSNAKINNLSELLVECGKSLDTSMYIPIRNGYIFGGWYDNAQCSGNAVTTAQDFQSYKSVLYAKWNPIPINVSSIELNKNTVTLLLGNTLTLTANVKPSNATNKNLKWESSNSSVATITPTGKISAEGIGTAIVTCSSLNGSKKRRYVLFM